MGPMGVTRWQWKRAALRAPRLLLNATEDAFQEIEMGKYFVGWLLGIPAVVLLVLWFFFR